MAAGGEGSADLGCSEGERTECVSWQRLYGEGFGKLAIVNE